MLVGYLYQVVNTSVHHYHLVLGTSSSERWPLQLAEHGWNTAGLWFWCTNWHLIPDTSYPSDSKFNDWQIHSQKIKYIPSWQGASPCEQWPRSLPLGRERVPDHCHQDPDRSVWARHRQCHGQLLLVSQYLRNEQRGKYLPFSRSAPVDMGIRSMWCVFLSLARFVSW